MQLSKRLLAVAKLVTRGNRLIDVGTDHGYLPIYLLQEGLIPGAVAMDVNRGPIERAQHNISMHQAAQYIETRLSDGVLKLRPGEGDSLVIAGMGGSLIIKILTEGEADLQDMKELILQPQSDIAKVRRFLREHQYQIVKEDMVWEDGKYYPMIKAVHGTMEEGRDIDECYGRYLLEHRHPVLLCFLKRELTQAQQIQERISASGSALSEKRAAEIEKEISRICSALKCYEV